MGLTLITPPMTVPVTIEDARRQCRIHASDPTYDVELQEYIEDAIAYLDGPNGILNPPLALEPQRYRYTLDKFDGDIVLPIGPLLSVESVEYYDAANVLQTIDDTLYTVALPDLKIVSNSTWPTAATGVEKVAVEFTAGFEGWLDSATYVPAVPRPLRRAILFLVGHWFAHKEPVGIGVEARNVPLTFEALIAPYKRPALA